MNSPSASAVKPGTFWYWLGGLLMLSSILGGGLIIVNALQTMTKTVDSFGRIKVPGGEGCKLVFGKPGRYTIYYEYQTNLPRRAADCTETGENEEINASAKKPFGLEISLVDTDGTEIPTSLSTAGDAGISMNGHIGNALREVTIDRPGGYKLKVGGVTEQSEPFVLAVGRGGIVRVAPYLLGGIALAGIGSLFGIVIMAITGSRRRKIRRLGDTRLSAAGGFGVSASPPSPFSAAPNMAPPYPAGAGTPPNSHPPIGPTPSRVLPPTPSLPWNEIVSASAAMPPPPPPPPPPQSATAASQAPPPSLSPASPSGSATAASQALPPPVAWSLPSPTGTPVPLPPPSATASGMQQPPPARDSTPQ